ncbi:hypothetical protein [Luxibacter massiliensis]|uniref:hypothetical protein n=1 Tax=Luxibacter massiliensis TaxID=2219695 RepID=UPI000F06C427|nr:hypothetical protein [Luxibacter massiliensis]
MLKKLSKKGKIGAAIGCVAVILIVALVAVLSMRVDAAEARQAALSQTGGGEVISQEIESEGLWNEYQFTISNGNQWYEIEVSGFGNITKLESGTGQYPID